MASPRFIAAALSLGILATAAPAPGAGAGPALEVEATGFKHDGGEAVFVLFDSGQGFPSDLSAALARGSAPIRSGKARFTVPALAPGDYAVMVFHDEDLDGKVASNFLGMPKEGVGVSNGAKGRFGPPAFRDASVRLGAEPRLLEIRVVYL